MNRPTDDELREWLVRADDAGRMAAELLELRAERLALRSHLALWKGHVIDDIKAAVAGLRLTGESPIGPLFGVGWSACWNHTTEAIDAIIAKAGEAAPA